MNDKNPLFDPSLRSEPSESRAPPSPQRSGPTGPIGPTSHRTLRVFQNEIVLPQIDDAIDRAFDDLYAAVTGNRSVDWQAFASSVDSFVRSAPAASDADLFFESATPGWMIFAQLGRYEDANRFWHNVVSAVTAAETAHGVKLHKGSGYYFWGCNAFSRGDVDTGLLLMHEALAEDVRTHKSPKGTWPNASATRVITLDHGTPSTHPASWWVAEQVAAIDHALSAAGGTLSSSEFRQRLFLVTDPANIFLFVYAHAALLRLEKIPLEHRDNDFVARLSLGHLFHLAVVLERAISARSNRQGEFMSQAEELSRKAGGKLKDPIPGTGGKSYASDISGQIRIDAEATISSLLDGSATYGTAPVLPVDQPICIAYALRNVGAHQTSAPPVVSTRVTELRFAMIAALASCVTSYY